MRRFLILLAAAVLIGGVLYQVLADGHNFLLISAGPYVIETSLWVALLLLVAAILLWRLVRKLYRTFLLPRRWFRERASKRRKLYRDKTVQGVLDYFEGNWDRAIANLTGAARRSDMPAVNYLGAANASFHNGDPERTLDFLDRAERAGAGDQFTAELLKVRLYLQEKNFDKALPIIERLHSRDPRHPAALRLLASARKGIRDWRGIETLLPDLKKYRALSRGEFRALETEVYRELLLAFPADTPANASRADRQSDLDHLWDSIPRHQQKNPELIRHYVRQLEQLGITDKAEARLRRHLKKHWDGALAEQYGLLEADSERQLASAEAWLKDHPDSAPLMRTLARLCIRRQLWGKARDYLENALKLDDRPETRYELGKLLTHMGEQQAGIEHYRQGLARAVGTS